MTTKTILSLRWKEGWFQTRIMVLPFLQPPPPFAFACGSGCGRPGSYYNRVWQTRISFSPPCPPPATPRPSFLPPSSSSFPCTFLSCSGIPSRRSVGRRGGASSLPPNSAPPAAAIYCTTEILRPGGAKAIFAGYG